MALTIDILKRQDDVTSERVLGLLGNEPEFKALASKEGDDIVDRDKQDEVKLAAGIKIAVDRGVLPADPNVAPTKLINVVGKTADEVAAELLTSLGAPGDEGKVIVLQGLSGTGKGTTVKKLQAALPNCVCWSNGNVFRTVTHLVTEHCEKEKIEFGSKAMTPELLERTMARLSFEKVGDDEFDVLIDGTVRVSSICNTTLKMPVISSRVPTCAEQTQGEVVKFAAKAVAVLQKAGRNVILEGRAQTLNYIPSPHRFELTIPDTAILGQRRAAQRVMAAALGAVKDDATEEDVKNALREAAKKL